MKPFSKQAGILLFFLILVSLTAGSAFLIPSFFSYQTVLDWAQEKGYVGLEPQLFTGAYFDSVVGRLRLNGGLILAFGLFLLFLRRKIRARLSELLQTQADSFARLAKGFRRFISDAIPNDGPWHWLALAGILITGIYLRMYYLSLPMRYDESATFMWYASQPFYVGLSKYTAPNNHLFHTLLVHLSYRLFGDSVISIRLPAFLAGISVIPASYLTFRYIYGKNTGLFTAALIACSSLLIQYSTNARGYTLVTLFFLLILLCLAYLRKHREPACWLMIAIFGALAMHTILSSLYILTIAAAWWTLSQIKGEGRFIDRIGLPAVIWTSLAMVLLTLLLYSPVLSILGLKALVANDYVSFGRQFPAGGVGMILDIASAWSDGMPWLVSGLWLLGLGVWIFLHRQSAGAGAWLVWGVIGGVAPILLVHGRIPPLRTWLFLLPVFLCSLGLFLTWAIEKLFRRKTKAGEIVQAAAPLALVLFLGGYLIASESIPLSKETGVLPDGPEIAAVLKDRLGPNDTVFSFCPANMPVYYYLRRQGRIMDEQTMYNPLNHDRVWLVAAPGQKCGKLNPPSIEELIKTWEFAEAGFGPPVLIQNFKESSLYLVEKAINR